jgi:hypothetical protein
LDPTEAALNATLATCTLTCQPGTNDNEERDHDKEVRRP